LPASAASLPRTTGGRQAYVPQGALALENPVGTAPCFVVETESGGVVISLPGVPREMEHMLAHAVAPYLRQKFDLTNLIKSKILRTVGIGESLVDERVGDLERSRNPTVGLAAHAGQTDIRITAKAASEAEADAMIADMENKVRERLGDFIYAEGKAAVEAVVGRMLAERGMTVAVAEAGTGGNLAGRLAVIPEAAQVFRGGTITSPGASTFEAAAEAERARAERGADWGLAVALIRQPESAHIEVALSDGAHTEASSFGYGGTPTLGYIWAGTAALNMLRLRLSRGR
jgi:hypothetical protein